MKAWAQMEPNPEPSCPSLHLHLHALLVPLRVELISQS